MHILLGLGQGEATYFSAVAEKTLELGFRAIDCHTSIARVLYICVIVVCL
jgi:hypothetical protein